MAATFQSGLASLERVVELLDAEEQSADAPPTVDPTPVRGRIVFDDVSFSYDPDKPLIEHLSLTAEPGQTIAIVGPTGAGKTWIAEQAIRHVFENGGRAWYACPLKALSNAKFTEFAEIFGAANVGILTGDRREQPEAPIIIGTTDEVNSLDARDAYATLFDRVFVTSATLAPWLMDWMLFRLYRPAAKS